MSCLLNLVLQFISWLVNITPQFVNWLLDEDLEKWDEHWMPVSLRCRWNRKIMISMKIIRTTYLWFRQIKIKVPWAPFWNVLILVYGHCPNSFRPPPLLCQTMTFLLFNLLVTYKKNIPRVCQLPFRYVIKYENLAKEWPHLLNRWNDPDYSILIEWLLLSFQPFFPVWESAKTRGQRCNCPGRTGESSKVVLEVEAASRRSTWTSCPARLWTSSSTSLPQTSPCLATLLKTNFRYNRKIKRLWWGTEISGMKRYKQLSLSAWVGGHC